MEVLYSGFDGGGWWLEVEGCQGVGDNRGLPENRPKISQTSWSFCWQWGRERIERKWSLWTMTFVLINQFIWLKFYLVKPPF